MTRLRSRRLRYVVAVVRAQVVSVIAVGVGTLVALIVLDRMVAQPPLTARAAAVAEAAAMPSVKAAVAETKRSTISAPASPRPVAAATRPMAIPAPRPATATKAAPTYTPPTPAPTLPSTGTPPAAADGSGSAAAPSRMRVRIRAAQAELDAGRYDQALASAKKLIEDRPEAKDAYPIAVKAACGLGNIDDAQAFIGQVATKQARRELRAACEASGTVVP